MQLPISRFRIKLFDGMVKIKSLKSSDKIIRILQQKLEVLVYCVSAEGI